MNDPARSAVVHLPRSLASLFPGGPRQVSARGTTVAELIGDLDLRLPGIRDRLVTAGPSLRTHINVFVNGVQSDLATQVAPGAVVHVIPAVSGGEPARAPLDA